MKRAALGIALTVVAALAVPALQADVKTRQKTQFKLEGLLGGVVNVFGGKAAREGITSTVAVRGHRKAAISDSNGQIIDLSEEKVYNLDVKKKEYQVVTFAQMREQWQKAKADAEKRAREMKPEEREQAGQTGKELEFSADVKETGNKKNIAGHDTREVILTVTGREKGKAIEESGGFIMTSTMWLAPRIAALDEQAQFDMKFFTAIYGEQFAADMQQMAGAMALYPAMKPMMDRMRAEGGKLQGTPLHTTIVFEGVKSAEQMKADAEKQQSSGGGGLSGMIGRRIAGGRGQPQQRATVMTIVTETLSVDPSATDADVAVPAGYKEKK
jgi:hypothetical protein